MGHRFGHFALSLNSKKCPYLNDNNYCYFKAFQNENELSITDKKYESQTSVDTLRIRYRTIRFPDSKIQNFTVCNKLDLLNEN